MRRKIIEIYAALVVLVCATPVWAQRVDGAGVRVNGVTSSSFVSTNIGNVFCVNVASQDAYVGRVGANNIGIYTGAVSCASGTLRFDVSGTQATFAVPAFTKILGLYGTGTYNAMAGLGFATNEYARWFVLNSTNGGANPIFFSANASTSALELDFVGAATSVSGGASTMTTPLESRYYFTGFASGSLTSANGQLSEWNNFSVGPFVCWALTDQSTCTAAVGAGTKTYLFDFSTGASTARLKGALVNASAGYQLDGVLVASATDPTIASGGCTSPAVTWANGTETFLLALGTSCTGVKTIVLTMPAASNLWRVECDNNTSDAQQSANYVVGRATSTTAVTLTNYARTTGIQADYTASDTLLCSASGG